jgi:glycosyltransferase involved in cell wall biosynthesis
VRIAYATLYDSQNVKEWSGLGLYISRALQAQGIHLEHLGPLSATPSLWQEWKARYYRRIRQKEYLIEHSQICHRHYARQIEAKLKHGSYDLVFGTHGYVFSQLECRQPIAFWCDSTLGGLVGFYKDYSNLCAESERDLKCVEQLALQRSQLAIFSSDWAAESATRLYQTPLHKVKVVPYGANIECHRTLDDIKRLIALRPEDKCKLLFLGKVWSRKGGDAALAVARRLNESGLPTELTLVGSTPPDNTPLPSYVRSLGFISKATPEGQQLLDSLFAESHFLILPSRAECFGVVFCEASSFGTPSLATNVGGISSAVRNGINGQTFPLSASSDDYCAYVQKTMASRDGYEALALSSFNEYQTRLNWNSAGKAVKELLEAIV